MDFCEVGSWIQNFEAKQTASEDRPQASDKVVLRIAEARF